MQARGISQYYQGHSLNLLNSWVLKEEMEDEGNGADNDEEGGKNGNQVWKISTQLIIFFVKVSLLWDFF